MLTTIKRLVKQITEHRSSQWPRVRKAYLADHPTCEACGTAKQIEIHHLIPFSHDASRELDPANLIALCESRECHFRIGHCFEWTAANSKCREDAATQLKRIKERIPKPIDLPDQIDP